jgi:hypothetical protein
MGGQEETESHGHNPPSGAVNDCGDRGIDQRTAVSLPDQRLIPKRPKTAYMLSIYRGHLWGERFLRSATGECQITGGIAVEARVLSLRNLLIIGLS